MRIYTVLEIEHLINTASCDDADDLGGRSVSCMSYEQAVRQLRGMVEDAVDDFYESVPVGITEKAEIVKATMDELDNGENKVSWETADRCYVWRIFANDVQDEGEKAAPEPTRSEKEEPPMPPESAKIGFKLRDKVTGEVYTYMFREPKLAFEFAKSIRDVMQPNTKPIGVYVWNSVKGERTTDGKLDLDWSDLLIELNFAACPTSGFSNSENDIALLEEHNRKYAEFYPGNVWSILLKHTRTLVVNVKAKTLDEAIEKVKAKGEINDWFADPDIWAWDSDGEPVEVDRKSCHAAPGEEEDF